ncbi:MAG: hypoxanthine phosphoribosyltransferase [Elusimicrobia bacterium]|nr:hypoxanthine phosphoribosyltransferase [Elusimicrobiota bacterium]
MKDSVKDDILEILIPETDIRTKVGELASRINADYRDKNPVFISVLKGSVIFLSDLMKNVDIRSSLDFIAVSSYEGDTESTGVVKLEMDLRESIEGRHVILVEDIVDTGLTMDYLKHNFMTRRPASFNICALLTKPERTRIKVDIAYKGFEIPDKFVVGYGLDYAECYRNLPFVATLRPEIYRKVK